MSNGNLWVIIFSVLIYFICCSDTDGTDSNNNDDTDDQHIDWTEYEKEWEVVFDNSPNPDIPKDIAVDSEGNIYVVGFGSQLVSGNSEYDWWIKKIDRNGC